MRLLLAAALFAGSLAHALAGDFAERSILGFSADGTRFAFEEFGFQDGSGFPFANLFVIDTTKDSWIEGSPVRVLEEDEKVGIATVRRTLASRAAPLLEGIDQPGNLLASNPITESGRNPYELAFKRYPELVMENGDLLLTLETIPLDAPDNKDDFFKTHGFRLKLNDGQSEVLLHEDKALPASRGIALDYRISDVVIHQRFGKPATLVVLILVIQRGFEGANGRYMAVTTRLPQ